MGFRSTSVLKVSTGQDSPGLGSGFTYPLGGVPRVLVCGNFHSNVSKFAPHKTLKLIARRNLTFDERVVLHRVASVNGLRFRVAVFQTNATSTY